MNNADVIARHMARFHEVQATMPWHGRTSDLAIEVVQSCCDDYIRLEEPDAFSKTNNWCESTVNLPKRTNLTAKST